MPPKKTLSSPVYEMPHNRQVELLSEALLREYMHRRKFTETLHAFDAENPRGSDTISSRVLMSDLMALKAESQQAMKGEGVETIMEMLCFLRVQRRLELDELKRRAAAEFPATPEKLKKSGKEKALPSTKSLHDDMWGNGRSKRRVNVEGKKRSGENGTKSSSRNRSNEIYSSTGSDTDDDKTAGGQGPSRSTDGKKRPHLGKKLARSVIKLLTGKNIFPSSLLEQGFAFDTEVEYGLIQWKRGLDGVIATVQAFLCVFFFKGGFIDVERHQRQCLLRAFTTLISMAQPNPRLVCLVDGSLELDNVELGVARLGIWRDFSSMKEVEETLQELLDRWVLPKSSGVLCFLISVLLSRGLEVCVSLMSHGATSLIDDEGRCTSDLVRFLLRGDPSRNGADGLLDELVLDGIFVGMECGYISSGPDGAMLDADGAKTPRHPVWVLHHNDRFAVLFLKKDTRRQFEQRLALKMPASSDLFFRDPASPENGERFFTVSAGSSCDLQQQSETEDSFLRDAIHTIPVWSGVEIDWNGSTPAF